MASTLLHSSPPQNSTSFFLPFLNSSSSFNTMTASLLPPLIISSPNYPSLLLLIWNNRKFRRHKHRCSRKTILFASGVHSKHISPNRSSPEFSVSVAEAFSDDELWAAARLRVRSFCQFNQQDPSFGIEDHIRYVAEKEFEAVKERLSGKRKGFDRVSCINASVPLSLFPRTTESSCLTYKCTDTGESRVVVGTLDLNQTMRLEDQIVGRRPENIGADFSRAYLSNVCVAKELHRKGIGYLLVAKSKKITKLWGMTDLYAHVDFDNLAAKNLYGRSGFIYESEEKVCEARFLGRPRRFLLWTDLREISLNVYN